MLGRLWATLGSRHGSAARHYLHLGVSCMFRMLIDTCVWLDLAKDQKQVSVLGVVEEMVKRGCSRLLFHVS